MSEFLLALHSLKEVDYFSSCLSFSIFPSHSFILNLAKFVHSILVVQGFDYKVKRWAENEF